MVVHKCNYKLEMNIVYVKPEPVQGNICCESTSPAPNNQHGHSADTQTKVYFSKNGMEYQPRRKSSSTGYQKVKHLVSEDEFLSYTTANR